MKFVGLILILAISSVSCNFWTPCPNIRGPTSVSSPACDANRCAVVRGQTTTFIATASFVGAHSQLMTRLTVNIQGSRVNVPIAPPNNNICNVMTPSGCPTVPNTVYRFPVPVAVPRIAPTGPTTARLELLENNAPVMCAIVNINIT